MSTKVASKTAKKAGIQQPVKAATKNAAKVPTKTAPATKSAAPAAGGIKKGDKVKFVGWEGDAPDGTEDITVGMTGEVRSVDKDGAEVELTGSDGEPILCPFALSEIEKVTAPAGAVKATTAPAAATKTAAKKVATKQAKAPEPEPEPEVEKTYAELGADADADEASEEGKAAVEILTDACTQAELDPNSFGTWAQVGQALDDSTVEAEQEEEQPAEPEVTGPQQSIGELADEEQAASGEGKNINKLTKSAEKYELDVNAYATWVEVEEAVNQAKEEAKAARNAPAEVITLPEVKKAAGSDPNTAAVTLASNADKAYFMLGGVLAIVQRDKTYETITDGKGKQLYTGFEGFEAFCENHVGVGYRKAKWLININQAFSAAGVDSTRLAKLGWAKAKELVNIVRQEPADAEKWIAKAEKSTREKITADVKTRLEKLGVKQHGNSTGPTVSMTSINLRVHEDQGTAAKEAFAKAKESLDEGSTDAQAFMHIITEWMSYQG